MNVAICTNGCGATLEMFWHFCPFCGKGFGGSNNATVADSIAAKDGRVRVEPLPEAPRPEEATCTCHLGPNSPRPCPVTHTAGSEEATEPAWLIFFEDADVAPIVFTGEGAEDAARAAFVHHVVNWNCHLFKSIASSCGGSEAQREREKGEAPPPTICPGCNKEIDPEVCGCGGTGCRADYDGHNFIPAGCACFRVKGSDER